MSQCYSVIIDRDNSAPGHKKEVVYGINDIAKRYIYQLMSNVQLPVSKLFDSQIIMNYCTQNNDANLAKELQKHMSKDHRKHGVNNQGKYIK